MPDAKTTEQAISLLEQIPLLGIFVLALVVILWVQRHWQAKETADWRAWASGERDAFEAALDRVVERHGTDLQNLGRDVREALTLLRETVRDSKKSGGG